MSKLDDDGRSLLVVEAPCAPSQKLKEDGKEAFHYVRLCFELNDQGKCVRVLNHPAATCACPVGCIWCAHKGSLLVLCHAIISYSTRWLDDNGTRPSFESIVSRSSSSNCRSFVSLVNKSLLITFGTVFVFDL